MTTLRIYLTVFFLLFGFKSFAEETYWVATGNPMNSNKLSVKELKDVFLGQKTLWANGDRIIVCHLKAHNKAIETFISTFLGMSSRQYSFYWKSKVFSGQGYPPKTFSSYSELVKFLKLEPRAIGVMDENPKDKLTVIYSAEGLNHPKETGLVKNTY